MKLNVFFKEVKSYFYLLLSAEPTNPLCLLDDPKSTAHHMIVMSRYCFMIIVYNNPLRLSRLCYKRLIVLELLYALLFAELAY